MSYKSYIKELAKEKGISAQQLQQKYLIELFLLKLSKSMYRDKFIIKGGFLIGELIGIEQRTTMDLDTSVKGLTINKNKLEQIFISLLQVEIRTSFIFEYDGIEEIRKAERYPGFRIKLIASFDQLQEKVAIDVTTGDAAMHYWILQSFERLFDNGIIQLLSYPVECVLAEKIETIISRGVASTRPRDYYDVYIISKIVGDKLDWRMLSVAFYETIVERNTLKAYMDWKRILEELGESTYQREIWEKYKRQYKYAMGITFEDVLDILYWIFEYIKTDKFE